MIDLVLQRDNISQEELAVRAGVSQPTVSRARYGTPKRKTRQNVRLFSYIQNRIEQLASPDAALDAVRQVWDGTPEHSAALAELISASHRLWPSLMEERLNDQS